MHPVIDEYLANLKRKSPQTGECYAHGLAQFDAWLSRHRIEPSQATIDDLRAFQRWLAQEYLTPSGEPLKRSTQATRLAAVKSFYRWLAKRGIILLDIAKPLRLPKTCRKFTQRDYLSLQEVTALLQTQAALADAAPARSQRRAIRKRDLALLCLAVATGRRRSGLLNLRVEDLNFKRDEIRFEWEKGKAGRVAPVARWAMAVARDYIKNARPLLRHAAGSPWLFVSERGERFEGDGFKKLMKTIHRATVEANPDLTELPKKHLTPHSLRVSFAKLLFAGGCNIRSINELMQHERLSTTAYYVPIRVEEMRRAFRIAHPRA